MCKLKIRFFCHHFCVMPAIASLAAVGVGFSGGLFLLLAAFLIYQAAQYASRYRYP